MERFGNVGIVCVECFDNTRIVHICVELLGNVGIVHEYVECFGNVGIMSAWNSLEM